MTEEGKTRQGDAKQATAAPKPDTQPAAQRSNGASDEGMRCHDCGRSYSYVYRVPDDVWEQIAPVSDTVGIDLGGLLCIDCADRRARDLGIMLYYEGTAGWWRGEDAAEIEQLNKFDIAELGENDVLVVRYHGQLTAPMADRISSQIKHMVPGGRFLVFGDEFDLHVWKQPGISEADPLEAERRRIAMLLRKEQQHPWILDSPDAATLLTLADKLENGEL